MFRWQGRKHDRPSQLAGIQADQSTAKAIDGWQ
jgi:hypothetical protein